MKQKNENHKETFTPTEKQFTAFSEAFKYFNTFLFNNQLPDCILSFSRKKKSHGYFALKRWEKVENSEESVHEISLSPYSLNRDPIEVYSTLVHEMVHLWQWEYGSPSRNGYHNKEWALKMEEVGLVPTDTGKPGGKKTGQSMTHFIKKGGMYEKSFEKLPRKFLLPFTSPCAKLSQVNRLVNSGRKKTKYTCKNCRTNVWGRPSLILMCGRCLNPFEVVD